MRSSIIPAALAAVLLAAPLAAALATPVAAAPRQDPVTAPSREPANRALIERAFAQWARGEADVFDLLTDDVVWHITGQDPAVATTYRSREALLAGAARPLATRLTAPLTPTVRRIWSDGDDVLVHWDGSAPLADGSTYRNTYLWIMTVRGDRVTRVTAFLDNAAFKAALAKAPRPDARD
ncbi:nuclear transport factor 2 family protein [uncultured Sphingomonas sp.]|uniref:nuclear transport factor 2 family protein n=1 Tax=uncultured Sphingomonas sp. TaxID=158754 RepID=UPI0025F6F588|nr:nuclear transport factor 2 family protein [uncultured Sphingomonas sp.]